MKSMLAHIACWMVALAIVLTCKLKGQGLTSRLTSDASQSPHGLPMVPVPTQSGIFVPPSDMIMVSFHTSTIPLVVRVEVSSNVWRHTVWYQNGQRQTNWTLMDSNLISAVTNEVVR